MRINGPLAYIALYGAMYAAFGVASPFWPKFYESKALTPQQVGIVLAVGMSMRLVAGPLIGLLADFVSALRSALSVCLTLAAAAAAALLWADTFLLLLWAVLLQAAALAPTTSLADAFAVNAAKPEVAGRPFEYGWIRGSASIAFIMGTLTVGHLVGPSDLTPIIWLNVALLLVSAGFTTVLPTVKTRSRSSTCAPPFLLHLRELFGIARFRLLLLVSALVLGSHAMHDAFAVIRWSEAGIGTSTISVLWSEAVAAEVIVFLVIGPSLLAKLGSRTAVALAAAAGIIRWTASGMTTSILLLSLIQPLHGFTFALLHLACMHMMATLVAPSLSATAQAFYAFGAGFVTTVLTLLAGILYVRLGGSAFFMMLRSAASLRHLHGLGWPKLLLPRLPVEDEVRGRPRTRSAFIIWSREKPWRTRHRGYRSRLSFADIEAGSNLSTAARSRSRLFKNGPDAAGAPEPSTLGPDAPLLRAKPPPRTTSLHP